MTPPSTSEGMTGYDKDVIPDVTPKVGVTAGVTPAPKGSTDMPVRLNPRTGLPYGPGMLGLLSTPQGTAALTEYERKYGQHAPVYGTGSIHQSMAEYAASDKFRQIYESLGPYADNVRVGCFGPTVAELYRATH
jgi:hypothetical protein